MLNPGGGGFKSVRLIRFCMVPLVSCIKIKLICLML